MQWWRVESTLHSGNTLKSPELSINKAAGIRIHRAPIQCTEEPVYEGSPPAQKNGRPGLLPRCWDEIESLPGPGEDCWETGGLTNGVDILHVWSVTRPGAGCSAGPVTRVRVSFTTGEAAHARTRLNGRMTGHFCAPRRG